MALALAAVLPAGLRRAARVINWSNDHG
jgi:hypothetical protein